MNPIAMPKDVKIKNNGPKMWLKMKTFRISSETDIGNILVDNNIKHLNNAFEMPFKDVKKFSVQLNRIGMDMVMFDAHLVPLTMQQSNSSFSLVREDSKNYFVSFVNIKNEKENYLSSLVNNLSERHRFVITDGVVLKNFSSLNNGKLTVAVRPENNSSVFLFKFEQCLKQLNVLIKEGLSKITDCGVYSLFGHITNIIKYTDEEFMLLRIWCFDKCVIKFQKYPEFVDDLKNISNVSAAEINYDLSSNCVDILIKNPSAEFLTLRINQRICLNKVIVKYSDNFKIFSLHANGKTKNLKIDPLETSSVKSLSPPNNKQFPIPNELKPVTRSKTNQMSPEKIPFSKDGLQSLNTSVCVLENTQKPIVQKSQSNIIQIKTNLKEHQLLSSTSSSDDNVNVNNDASHSSYKTNDNICLAGKITNLNSVNEIFQSTPKTQLVSLKRESSPDSTDCSCSPLLFNTSEISAFSQDNQSKKLYSRTAQSIGPCTLVELIMDNIVCGYCTKCCVIFPKALLIKSNFEEYICPNCSDIVSLTLFFKMTFLHGSTDSHNIEVCCYNENAECVFNKLLKKDIKLTDYLRSSYYTQLFENTVELLIKNHTKMNIVVCHSPVDNAYILLSLDTESVVTNPIT